MFLKTLLTLLITASGPSESWTGQVNEYGEVTQGLGIQSSFYINDPGPHEGHRIVVVLTNVPNGCALYQAGRIKRYMFSYQIEVASPETLPSHAWDTPTPLAHGFYAQLDERCSRTRSWHAARGSVSLDQFSDGDDGVAVGRFALYNEKDLFLGAFQASRCDAERPHLNRWICE